MLNSTFYFRYYLFIFAISSLLPFLFLLFLCLTHSQFFLDTLSFLFCFFFIFFIFSFSCSDDEDVVKKRGPDGTVGRDLVVM